jgi:uncharacterized Zn finger protein (UPF0148 family)
MPVQAGSGMTPLVCPECKNPMSRPGACLVCGWRDPIQKVEERTRERRRFRA